MLTDIKLSKAQIPKIIQSGRSFGFWLANLGKEALANVVLLQLDISYLDQLGIASNAINKFERKIREKIDVRVGKGFNLFISNEDMNDIFKIIKSLEDSNVLMVLLKQ